MLCVLEVYSLNKQNKSTSPVTQKKKICSVAFTAFWNYSNFEKSKTNGIMHATNIRNAYRFPSYQCSNIIDYLHSLKNHQPNNMRVASISINWLEDSNNATTYLLEFTKRSRRNRRWLLENNSNSNWNLQIHEFILCSLLR